MSTAGVGLAFASLCAAREWWHWYAPRVEARKQARAACESLGHVWGEPFASSFAMHRECQRCDAQEHWSEAQQRWE